MPSPVLALLAVLGALVTLGTSARHHRRLQAAKKPNIVLVLTDDQDIELGSMNFMPRTLKILGEGGAHFPNAYVTTPMCCPSRSSLLTGMYAHNHNVFTNNDNCSSPAWQMSHEPRTFATYLSQAGYRTAYIGKYLNEYNGSYIPPGWREWSGLVRNSRYYNYTVNSNGLKIRHGDDPARDYYPDLIANESLNFLTTSKNLFAHKPVMMVLSFPSPHGPEDSAPQFQDMFHNVTTHRTPSWNLAPNQDKQWLLRHTGKMAPIHAKFTDVLHTKRLQTLQSVDQAVDRLYRELVRIGEADNTYIFFTSDHGYHLGQFGLVKGKSMPFEFDVRVPFFVRGPHVTPGVRLQQPVINLDLAPTFLDIAGLEAPPHMDGRSVLPLLLQDAKRQQHRKKRSLVWRDSFLIERGKVAKELQPLPPVVPKEVRVAHKCRMPQFASPCKPYQKWECVLEGGRMRMRKCRPHWPRHMKTNCICPPPGELMGPRRAALDLEERRMQRRFLKEHVHKDFKPIFLKPGRGRRDGLEGLLEVARVLEKPHRAQSYGGRCVVLPNSTLSCPPAHWQNSLDQLDHIISQLKIKLEKYKVLRRQLKKSRTMLTVPQCECANESVRLPDTTRHRDEKKKERKLRRKAKFVNMTSCNIEKMNCFTHDNDHWKTPPFWTDGPFCFCQNANNNTYWCVRTINATHNTLYCEFITGFIAYFDLKVDPYQLYNTVHSLDAYQLAQLQHTLNRLRSCRGLRECSLKHKSTTLPMEHNRGSANS